MCARDSAGVQKERDANAKRIAREAREARARKADVARTPTAAASAAPLAATGGSSRALPVAVEEAPAPLVLLYPWTALDRDWLEVRDRQARHRATKARIRADDIADAEVKHKVRGGALCVCVGGGGGRHA